MMDLGQPRPQRDYCKKPLPTAIDEIARDHPTRIWASLPVDDWDLTQGFEDISFRRLARAINKVAHALDAALGPRPPRRRPSSSSAPPETLAYIGVPDVRYQIAQVAAVKAGYKILLSSPLNSTNIHVSLMEQTACVAVLSAVGVRGVDEILRWRPGMKHATIAELDDLLGEEGEEDEDDEKSVVPPYPFPKSWEDCAYEEYMILHSRSVPSFLHGAQSSPPPLLLSLF